jgi:hypothetical protein
LPQPLFQTRPFLKTLNAFVPESFAFILQDNNARFEIFFFNSLRIESPTIPRPITKKPQIIMSKKNNNF